MKKLNQNEIDAMIHIVSDTVEDIRCIDVDRLYDMSGPFWPQLKCYILSQSINDRTRNAINQIH
jgi:hypothetical protein